MMAWLYPEHEKRKQAEPFRRQIEEFLRSAERCSLVLCNAGSGMRATPEQVERALKDFFQFDDKAFEQEKAQMAERKRALAQKGTTR